MCRDVVVLLSLLLFFGVPQTVPAPSPEATAYIDAALTIMQANFLHKDRIDWPSLRRETLAQAAGAQTPVDTYPAIRFALAKLGDHHSYLQLTPALTQQEALRQPHLANPATMPAQPARKPTFPFPSPFRTRRVPEGAILKDTTRPLADVVIPLFSSPNRKDLDDFATAVQKVIAQLSSQHPCGWIVDLRGNGGGNIWAMLAGVGPILGEGEPGAVLHGDGSKEMSFYEKGRAGRRNDPQDPDYAKTNEIPVVVDGRSSVAVLIDRETGSSGEGIAIAFHGRPGTRFFGESTFGAATSTFPYTLPDGAQIYLVTGAMLDRNGNEYPDGVTPDQEILSEATITPADPVVHAASDWLLAQPACRTGAIR